MRMFVAVRPPEHVVASLEDFLGPRREAAALRWTLPESWHLTLAFLPAVPERAVDDLVERLARAARRRHPIRLALAGGGAFPGPARARVLYAAVRAAQADATELDRLATGCRAAANKAGAGADGGRFRPHLTLARSGRPFEATRWLRVLSAWESEPFTVTEVELVESFLGQGPRNRPRYEVRESFPLARPVPAAGARNGPTDAPAPGPATPPAPAAT